MSNKPAPLLTGMDLIQAGLKPDRNFKKILSKAYDHQLKDINVTKEALLKEALKHKLKLRRPMPD